jgi:hypothetical protein
MQFETETTLTKVTTASMLPRTRSQGCPLVAEVFKIEAQTSV